jgi:ubiquinone/menaquinone biosynthesis C-methylase UbiE
MSTSDARFTGSVPAIYEQYLFPLLFAPYAEDLAARVADLKQGTLVEVAAGTGAVTRALLKTLPSSVNIIATDLNDAMLRLGAERASGPSVKWKQADAQQLPFEDASADAMLCQFGVMFFPDKPLAYREARRVLRPGGRYIFNVWDRLEHNEVSLIVQRAVGSLFPQDPPRFFERTPFGYYDTEAIRAALEAAGFAQVGVQTVEKTVQVGSAEHAAIGLCQGTPLRGEIEARSPTGLEAATAAATEALTERFGRGSFEHQLSAHVVTAS